MLRTHIVATVFRKELRELLRDRRSLLIMFGIPLVLYPLLTVALGNLAKSQQQKLKDEPAKVIVRNADAAPILLKQLRAAGSGIDIVGGTSGGAATATTSPASGPSTLPSTSAAPAATQPTTSAAAAPPANTADLESGKVDAILEIPAGAESLALEGGRPEFVYRLNRSRFQKAGAAERKIEKALREYERWVIEQRLTGRGVPPTILAPLKTTAVDVATGGQRLGSLMSTMLPMFLLLTGTLGAFFPAINATTTERERGTMETLLATPAGRTEVLVGKALLVLAGSLLTAGLNLLSMALVLKAMFAGAARIPGAADLAIDPLPVALAFLAAVPTLVFLTGLTMVAGLFARTFQEANALALPVMLLPMTAVAIGMADPPTTPGLLVTPIANTTVIIRDVLTGRATVGAFLLASAASCLYAGLLLSAAARVFNTEQLVNPAWEPLSMKGLKLGRRRGGGAGPPRPRRLPSVDAALSLFALTLLLLLYTGPALLGLDLLTIVLISQLALIAAPALLLAAAARWQWVQTFSLRKAPWLALAGALLVGVGLVPVIDLLGVLQGKVWPGSPEQVAESLRRLLPSVQARPVLTAVAIGVLAGVCEELLYRGPIQAALLRRLPVWPALAVGAALFAAAHMDAHGFPIRTLLGLLLGYVVWRGKSVFPAMLIHGAYDAAVVGRLGYVVHTRGPDETKRMAMDAARTALDGTFWLTFAAGVILLVGGSWLFRTAWRRGAMNGQTTDPIATPTPGAATA